MSARPSLALVPDAGKPARKPRAKPTPDSVKKLQRRARNQAKAIILDAVADMEAMAQTLRRLKDLGDGAPVGVLELSPRVADDLEHKAATMRQLLARQT